MEGRLGIGNRAWAVVAAVVVLSLALVTSPSCSETGCSEVRKTVTRPSERRLRAVTSILFARLVNLMRQLCRGFAVE